MDEGNLGEVFMAAIKRHEDRVLGKDGKRYTDDIPCEEEQPNDKGDTLCHSNQNS